MEKGAKCSITAGNAPERRKCALQTFLWQNPTARSQIVSADEHQSRQDEANVTLDCQILSAYPPQKWRKWRKELSLKAPPP